MGSCLSRRNPHSRSGSNVSNSQSLGTGQASNGMKYFQLFL